jgi:hypothetical protein
VLSIPALIAFTSARLSFFVRPFTEGTVTGGSLAAVSFPAPDTVLAVLVPPTGDAAATGTICGVDEAVCTSLGTDSPPGEGLESRAAAQASAVANVKEKNMPREE